MCLCMVRTVESNRHCKRIELNENDFQNRLHVIIQLDVKKREEENEEEKNVCDK